MKFQIVNDDFRVTERLWNIFFSMKNVRVTECGNIGQAVKEILDFRPDVVFLDHRLSPGGNEGFEIVDLMIKGVKFYSTTSNPEVVDEYRKRGVEVIGLDIEKIKAIIHSAA
jgi:hypothetical protein